MRSYNLNDKYINIVAFKVRSPPCKVAFIAYCGAGHGTQSPTARRTSAVGGKHLHIVWQRQERVSKGSEELAGTSKPSIDSPCSGIQQVWATKIGDKQKIDGQHAAGLCR